MAIEVSVPRLGWSMDEGTFLEWLKRDGEFVRKGEMLFVLEGDKASQEVESFDEGYLHVLPDAPQPGETVQVGQVLALLLSAGEAPPAPGRSSAAPTSKSVPVVSAGPQHAPAAAPKHLSRTAKASPRARRAASRLQIDWTHIAGTGRNGRVRERDVLAAARGGDQVAGKVQPHTSLRRAIAARMVAAAQQVVPVTLTTKVDATNLVSWRDTWRAAAVNSEQIVPSYTDMLMKLTAAALQIHPLLQAQWREEGLFVPSEINIGVAVDTEAGLLVPVVRHAASQSLQQIAAETRTLIHLARERRLTPQHMQGGTFTITNLGSFGIDAFTPVIQLPQSAVLGIGRLSLEPVVVNGQILPRHMISLSLTFDHRVMDGAPAARFLADLSDSILRFTDAS